MSVIKAGTPLSELPEDPPARMEGLSPDEFTEETEAYFGRWTGGYFKNVDKHPPLLTFAHHTKLADLFSQFNVHILTTNTMPPKQRQIAILRTAWICQSPYAWSSHLNTTLLSGLDEGIFGPVQVGADDPYFTPFERTVIRATEELIANHEVGDENWALLMAEWNNQQMLDFLFTVGTYVMVSGVLRTTRVRRLDDLRTLAARHGAPA